MQAMLWLVLICVFQANSQNTKTCRFFEECKGSTEVWEGIICSGTNSCQEASLTGWNQVTCPGAFSCTNLEYGYYIRSGLGLYALYNSSFIPYKTIRNWLDFGGEKSCADCGFERPIYNRGISWDGYMAGINVDLTMGWSSYGSFAGGLTLVNSTINITQHVNYQRFTGYYAAYNTDIYCDAPIECTGFACSGIRNFYRLDNCQVICRGSFKTDLCPRGYDDAILDSLRPNNLLYNNHDLFFGGFDVSTFENSADLYQSPNTILYSGELWDGSSLYLTPPYDNIIDINVNKTIVCGGAGSCRVSNFATSSTYKNASIRCDGGWVIYGTLRGSCERSNFTVTGSSQNGNIFCTGAASCQYARFVFETPGNMYCTGSASCASSSIINARNVFLGAANSGSDVEIKGVSGNVYILGEDAGKTSGAPGRNPAAIIENVKGTIYALGYGSGPQVNNATQIIGATSYCMTRSVITNVPKTYLVGEFSFLYGVIHGTDATNTEFTCRGICCACWGEFYGVSNIFIEDEHPLWAATIEGFLNFRIKYSNIGYSYNITIVSAYEGLTINTNNYRGNANKYLTLEGNPELDEVIQYDVTCAEGDSLYIRCTNQTSCAKMNLVCNGCCFLDCIAGAGFSCPNVTIGPNGQLLDYDATKSPTSVTSSPTSMPSERPTDFPSDGPTNRPSVTPTLDPSNGPTNGPSDEPTKFPTSETNVPSTDPTNSPSKDPTNDPSSDPTTKPTVGPTSQPTTTPTKGPTRGPTVAESCTFYPGLRYGGSKIGNTNFGIPDADTCCDLCYAEPECLYFRYRASNQRCILLRSLGNIRNNGAWESGEKDNNGQRTISNPKSNKHVGQNDSKIYYSLAGIAGFALVIALIGVYLRRRYRGSNKEAKESVENEIQMNQVTRIKSTSV